MPGASNGPSPQQRAGKFVQEGEVMMSDGDDIVVYYKTPFPSPPRLEIVELKLSWFKEVPFDKKYFRIYQIESGSFHIANDHPEKSLNAWAIVKWRAEGSR
jgi:hypothetical protein